MRLWDNQRGECDEQEREGGKETGEAGARAPQSQSGWGGGYWK